MNIFDASIECARYIFDGDCEQVSYQEHVQEGNDPRDHIFYLAAIVVGEELQEFQNDIQEYLNQISSN